MRFLLGLALGVAMVLLAVGVSTDDGAWSAGLAATSQRLRELARSVASAHVPEQAVSEDSPVVGAPSAPPPAPSPVTSEPAQQPMPPAPNPGSVDGADPVPEVLPTPPIATARREQAPVSVAIPHDQAAGYQTVWVPFHSELSAQGFAERLTASLKHPFRVERQGPGRYQVVFGYADETQRQSLLEEATRATGLPL